MIERCTPKGLAIFVIPDQMIDRTESGIMLSDYSKKRPTSGTILAVGEKVSDFKKGDRVIYGDFSGLKVEIDNREIFIMHPEDIAAILLPEVLGGADD